MNSTANEVKPCKLSPYECDFLMCLEVAIDEHGIEPPASLFLPASITRVVNYKHVKAQCLRGRPKISKAELEKSLNALMMLEVVGIDAPFVWHTGRAVGGVRLS